MQYRVYISPLLLSAVINNECSSMAFNRIHVKNEHMMLSREYALNAAAQEIKNVDLQKKYDMISLMISGPIPTSDRVYVVNGWRWHTLSVILHLNMFTENILAHETTRPVHPNLTKGFHFVFDYNWKSLLRYYLKFFILGCV